MIPDRTTSMQLLNEAYELNPGPWKAHSLVTAECAEKIAACCPGMDSEKPLSSAFSMISEDASA